MMNPNNPTSMLAQQVAQRAHPIPNKSPYQRPGAPQMTGAVGAVMSGNGTPAQAAPYLSQAMPGNMPPGNGYNIDPTMMRRLQMMMQQQQRR